jgi:hypothetical protein
VYSGKAGHYSDPSVVALRSITLRFYMPTFIPSRGWREGSAHEPLNVDHPEEAEWQMRFFTAGVTCIEKYTYGK